MYFVMMKYSIDGDIPFMCRRKGSKYYDLDCTRESDISTLQHASKQLPINLL